MKINVANGSWAQPMVVAYAEFIEFIVASRTPQDVLEFTPSDATKSHVANLIAREKTMALSPEDRSELDHYLHLEHAMRLAKARARQILRGDQAPCP